MSSNSKNPLRDIIPPKRSIREIPIPAREENKNAALRSETLTDGVRQKPSAPVEPPPIRKTKEKTPRGPLWILVIIVLLALFVTLSWVLEGATVSISPKKYQVDADTTLKAEKDAAEGLSYSTVTLELKDSREVTGSGSKEVIEKASGTIIIYNNHNSSPQNLVANTRFETPGGLIFRIEKVVTIPGKKTVGGKETPGSVEAKIVADKAGPEYNVGYSDFTVPGLKDDPRYNGIYARSKTPIEGGAAGSVAIVANEDLQKAKEEIAKSLEEKMLSQAITDIPEGFFIPADFHETSVSIGNPKPGSEGKAVVEGTATFTGYILNKSELFKALLQAGETSENFEMVNFDGKTETLTFTKKLTGTTLEIEVKGQAIVETVVENEKIKESLAGKKKNDAQAILAAFPGIEKAKVVVRPFWKGSIPDSSKKIKITIE